MRDRRARAKVRALIAIARVNALASLPPQLWPRGHAVQRYRWLAAEAAAGRIEFERLRREMTDLLPVVLGPIPTRRARSE